MSYQEEQFLKIAKSIRVMQGGSTDSINHLDFANQIRNIDRDTLPYKSTIALEDNAVVVEDSLDDDADGLTVYGASEQTVTVQGKNLYDAEKYPFVDGRWVHKSTGVLSSNDVYKATEDYIPIAQNTTYTINYRVDGANPGIAFYDEDKVFISGIKENVGFTTPDDAVYMRFTVNIDDENVQLEYGSEVTDYEPFVPDSPSPDYPAEIRSVGGSVTVQGKNLFDLSVENISYTNAQSISIEDGIVTAVLPSSNLQIYFNLVLNSGVTYRIYNAGNYISNVTLFRDVDSATNVSAGSSSGGTITPTAQIFFVTLNYPTATSYDAGDTYIVDLSQLQLELGSEATDYEPYQEPTTIEIPTLYGVGDVKDVMYIDRAQERAWVERNFSTIFLDGVETVFTGCYTSSTSYVRAYNISTSPTSLPSQPGLCDKYIVKTSNSAGSIRLSSNVNLSLAWGTFGLEYGVSTNSEILVAFNNHLIDIGGMTTIYQVSEPYIEELDYSALPTFAGGTTIMITPSDDSPSPVVSEVTLRTTTDHENEDIVSMALTSMGVETSGDTETDLASLETLGVDAYSVTSYDTSETYADEVEAMGVQSTNDAETNIEILSELGVSVYE